MSSASILDSFLGEIVKSLRQRSGHGVADLIQLDFESMPPAKQKAYSELNMFLNASYSSGRDSQLTEYCRHAVPEDEFGSFSTTFGDSLAHYFRYTRDFTTADNQTKALKIRQLTSQCITALGDTKHGFIMIPIVLSFSRTLAAVATNLDRNPELLKQSLVPSTPSGPGTEDSPSKVTFVEDAANVLRDAFIKCLAGSPGTPRTSRPAADDKRSGIYLAANSTLKLLFRCRKLRNAQQMFLSIDAQSPPLSFYPAAQRVTFLYYLGRYHFANNHFYRAALTLQAAYDQSHRDAVKHRRVILIYLIASNIILGRSPTSKLLMRLPSEAGKSLMQLCRLIKTGDLRGFHDYLDLQSPSAQWFLKRRILLQIRNRCEILVWRSVIRKTFILSGFHGEDGKVPFLRLANVLAAAQWALTHTSPSQGSIPFTNNPLSSNDDYIDPDFQHINEALTETNFDLSSGTYTDTPTQQQFEADTTGTISAYEVESIMTSLVQQGFLRGFVLHANPRFAIPRSKASGGPLKTGFPEVWDVIRRKEEANGEGRIPGWVKAESLMSGGGVKMGAGTGGSMAGRVVRLSGARPVGVGS